MAFLGCLPRRCGPLNSALERAEMFSEAPAPVRIAIVLLWGSLALGVIEGFLEIESLLELNSQFQLFMAVGSAIAVSIMATLIYLASRQKNWARVALLMVIVFPYSTYLIFPSEAAADPLSSWVLIGIISVCDAVALLLLFIGRGARWFSATRV